MTLENLSFRGGCHFDDHKELTNSLPLEEGPEPDFVRILLHQHTGVPCEPLVAKGDEVKMGQKIGEAKATITAPVHSSVSGTVVKIEEVPNNKGGKTKAIIIENDKKYIKAYEEKKNTYLQMSPEEIIDLVYEAGVVGLGGAGFPAAVKLKKRTPDQVTDMIIINGAECEPYLTSDQMAMENFSEEIFMGTDIIRHAMGAKEAYIGVEDNKPRAITKLRELESKYPQIKVASLKTKYPQGDMRRLIDAITGKKLAKSTSATKAGIQVFNVSTARSIYEAVVLEKPLYEKIVTVTGHALKEPKNLLCKVGTSIEEILAFCGGFKTPAKKVILGGPMMGDSVFTLDIPTTKALGGIISMTEEEVKEIQAENCIKCGKCVDVCPIHLMPLFISQYSLMDLFEKANENGVLDCIECGSCSYICPSHRPLIESIIHGKNQIYAQEQSR